MKNPRLPESELTDQLDRAIVRGLQLHPRVPFSDLGTALGVSEQTVARRYRRMHREGLVRIVCRVDPRALGLTDWVARVRCRPDGADSLARAIAQREDTSWVGVMSGGSEVGFALRSRSDAAREDLLVRLPKSAPVIDVQAMLVLRRYLGGSSTDWSGYSGLLPDDVEQRLLAARVRPRSSEAPEPTGALAAADHALVDVLSNDGRANYATVARQTGLSVGQVTRRLAALEESGVAYFDIDIAPVARLAEVSATLWLQVSPAHVDQAGRELAEHRDIQFAALITGVANLTAAVTCSSTAALAEYVSGPLAEIAGVRGYELAPISRHIKQANALLDGDRLAVGA